MKFVSAWALAGSLLVLGMVVFGRMEYRVDG